MRAAFDLVVIGSGFAGSLLAMIARRLGCSVALIERGKHPRFAIGESSTPLANLLLEELATRYDLPRLLPLTKWGTWQRTHPEMPCGLKRGFTFFHHRLDRPFVADPHRGDQLLVAASPHDDIADTHWLRADFDHFLVQEARALGVEFFDETALEHFTATGNGALLEGKRRGWRLSFRARFVVDAGGPRGFLHRALRLPEIPLNPLPPTQALFTHFTGVARFAGMLKAGESSPYAADDGAVHHIFDGGWIWLLRFNNGITSVGAAARSNLADELRFGEGAPAWDRLLERLPSVQQQFEHARTIQPFTHLPRLSFRSGAIAGNCWALLPSTAGFVDPLLSTGFPLTLLGVVRLAEALAHKPGSGPFREQLANYAADTAAELAATARLVAALYACMDDFPTFAMLTRLYFAAASFSETARRLGRPEIAGGFLMHDHPRFGPESRRLCQRMLSGINAAARPAFREEARRAIEPFDVAGLCNPDRRNWHPALAADLYAAAGKLDASHAEIAAMLIRCGLFTAPSALAPE